MKTLYFDCSMGAAGDMLMASLLELNSEPEKFLEKLNQAGIPGVTVSLKRDVKCGIAGTSVSVTVNGEEEIADEAPEDVPDHAHADANTEDHAHAHDHSYDHAHDHTHAEAEEHAHTRTEGHAHHPHRSLREMEQIIDALAVSERVRADVKAVYGLIAAAESRAHGQEVSQVHFHEVGAMDAVADITGVSLLIEALAPDQILASPINVGSGQVKCAHGILPVPAPATADILKGVPIYSGAVKGELCTPTGAALLKHFVTQFGPMPVIRVSRVGYGMGKKDFETANCVRAFLGETEDQLEDTIELLCNLDDMTPEAVSYAASVLFDAGAMDVYLTPITMKKNRLGTMLTCMCDPADREKMLGLIFKHTSTLGVREVSSRKYRLHREERTVHTALGEVRIKRSFGYGVEKEKPEYQDVARIAAANDLSIAQVIELLDGLKKGS